MRVKAQIARPAVGEVVNAGSTYRVHGAAWSGEDELASVEISTDDGANVVTGDVARRSEQTRVATMGIQLERADYAGVPSVDRAGE